MRSCVVRAASALVLCGLAAAPATAAFSIDFSLELELNNPTGEFQILPFIDVFGFDDDGHPDNTFEVRSPNGMAFGDGTGIGSVEFATLADMLSEAGGTWSIETYDGVTADTRSFEFDVLIDAGLTSDYFRAITPLGIADGDTIPASPTLNWMTAPAAFPEAEYDAAFGSVQGDAFVFDAISPAATSWSPSIAPLAPGTYNLYIFLLNGSNFDQSLVEISDPYAVDGGDDPDSFFSRSGVRSTLALRNLVVPSPGAGSLLAVVGLAAVRRRRG